MPRNAAGNYALPLPPVVPGNAIVANFENTTDSDIAAEITNSLDRNGRGGMLAPFKISDGTVNAPGIAFTQDPDNGIYRYGNDQWALAVAGVQVVDLTAGRVGINGALVTSGTASFAGTVTVPKLIVNDTATFNATVSFTSGFSVNGSGSFTGALGIADGTVAAPGLAFTADPDNGLFRTAANQWAMAVGGVQLVDLQAARVGIAGALVTTGAATFGGTVTAQNALTVAGLTTLNSGVVISGAATINGTLTVGAPGGTISAGDVTFRDVTADRANGSGIYFFSSGQTRYAFYDGAKYTFKTAPVHVEGSLGVALGAALLANPLQVGVAANQYFAVTAANGLPLIGAVDGTNNLINASVYGTTAFVPAFDNGNTLGDATHRWKSVWAVDGAIQTSDARLKKNVADSVLGLSFIEGLRPVSYQWINGGNTTVRTQVGEETVPGHVTIDGVVVPPSTRPVYELGVTPTPGTATHFGLIAQEVRQAVIAVGVDIKTFGGFVQVDPSNPESELGLNYGEFISPLIKAVQEISARLTAAGIP